MKEQPEEKVTGLVQEQSALLKLMEKSIEPTLLHAVQQAYHASDKQPEQSSMDISYEGTIHA